MQSFWEVHEMLSYGYNAYSDDNWTARKHHINSLLDATFYKQYKLFTFK